MHTALNLPKRNSEGAFRMFFLSKHCRELITGDKLPCFHGAYKGNH